MHNKIYWSIILIALSSINILAQKISTSKFGDIRNNMTYEEVSKLNTRENYVLNKTNEEMPEQHIIINEIPYHVVYYKNLKTKRFEIYSIGSSSKNLSTLSGIKVGNTLNDLWKNYKQYDISVKNNYDSVRVFILNDLDNGCSLVFYLNNNNITKIKLINESAYLNNNIYEN